MKKLIFLLVGLLLSCQTHRVRHTARRDSSTVTSERTITRIDQTAVQAISRNWQQWLAESTAVVILPKGPVTFNPEHGFSGEAKAILTYTTADHRGSASQLQVSGQQTTELEVRTADSAMQTHSEQQRSATDRQPVSGFSFRWLAVAFLAACLFILIRYRYYR